MTIQGLEVAQVGFDEGFQGIGKLQGAHLHLWQALVKDFLDHSRCTEIYLRDRLVLFNSLSVHQRLRLLREVSVGLLCESSPLPPESPWHYAAYFAPIQFIVLVVIRKEIDDFDSKDPWCDSAMIEKHQKEERKLEQFAKCEEMALHELLKREREELTKISTESLLEATDRSALINHEKRWVDVYESHPVTRVRKQEVSCLDAASDFHEKTVWRNMLYDFLVEQQTRGTYTSVMPNPLDRNLDTWEYVFGNLTRTICGSAIFTFGTKVLHFATLSH